MDCDDGPFSRMCDVLEMLVTRLSNLEDKVDTLVEVARFNAESAPIGSAVRCKAAPPAVVKHYDGPLAKGETVAVRVDVMDELSVVETRMWASGQQRLLVDAAVEAALGIEAADAVRRRVARHYETLPDDEDDVVGLLAAKDFGLEPPRGRCVDPDFTRTWSFIGIKHAVPEVLALGRDELVIKVPHDGWTAKDAMDTLARVYHLLERDPRKHLACRCHLYPIPRQLVPLVECQGDSVQDRWKQLTEVERRGIAFMASLRRRVAGRADFGAWFEQCFTAEDSLSLSHLCERYHAP